jgi:pimeloyl-ACP methyl ester carboxylesterase
MATLPAPVLLTFALGLLALVVAGASLAVLSRGLHARRVRALDRTTASRATTSALTRDSARRSPGIALVAASVVLLVLVFAGRFVVQPFFPSGTGVPVAGAPTSSAKVRGGSGAELAVVRQGTSGPTLVLTHGWGADRDDWAYAAAALRDRFQLVLWDLPGLGESTPTGGHDYAMQTLAADLDRVVQSVPGPVILVGHSIGGILNLEYARRYPDRMGRQVRGLVQVDTTFTNPIETKKNPERSRALQKPLFEPLLHVVSWTSPAARVLGWLAYTSGLAHLQLASQSFAGAETWDQLDHMASYAYRSSPRVVAEGVLGMLHWDGSDVLANVSVPTLVISGNQDVTTLPWASDYMARAIPLAQRASVDRAAHLGPVEQSARYADLIGTFASRINLSPSAPQPALAVKASLR